MKLLMCGDFHMNTAHALDMHKIAVKHECDCIVQLGDFGYWPRQPSGIKYLTKISQRFTIPVIWIDGNHEDFYALYDNIGEMQRNAFGMYELMPNIHYSPRGNAWWWNGMKFASCGGAYSIDRQWRTLGHSYFNEELITQRDCMDTAKHGKVDVLLTHDSPLNAPLFDGFKNDPITATNRSAVQQLVDIMQPSFLFHGHYHYPYTEFLKGTWVYGLNKDDEPNSHVMLNTHTKEVYVL